MSEHANRIAIMTDSTCDIPSDLIEKYQIISVPLYVVWGAEELRDGVDIDNETFYARLPEDPVHPKTSQPTPTDFERAIKACGAQEVVILTIADELSGTYDSAQAARETADVPVYVEDTLSVSMGLGWQVLAAARAREQGGGVEEMLAAARHVREGISVLFTVDTLEYLHKGGRIGGAAKLLGTALQLKPLLMISNTTGGVEAAERTRTRAKALERVVEATFERVDPGKPMRVGVLHGAAPDEAQALAEQIEAQYNPLEITISAISPVLGVHAGPGMVGIGAYNE